MTTGSPTSEVVDGDRLTEQFRAMTPLQKWETLVLSGLIGTDEPWIADMRASLQSLEARIEETAHMLWLGVLSVSSHDGHCVRIDFPNREEADQMFALLESVARSRRSELKQFNGRRQHDVV